MFPCVRVSLAISATRWVTSLFSNVQQYNTNVQCRWYWNTHTMSDRKNLFWKLCSVLKGDSSTNWREMRSRKFLALTFFARLLCFQFDCLTMIWSGFSGISRQAGFLFSQANIFYRHFSKWSGSKYFDGMQITHSDVTFLLMCAQYPYIQMAYNNCVYIKRPKSWATMSNKPRVDCFERTA